MKAMVLKAPNTPFELCNVPDPVPGPGEAVARVIAWFEERFSPHRPYASEVRREATPGLQMDPRPPRKP